MSLGPAIKTTYNGKPIRLFAPTFRTYQMAELGTVGVESIRARVSKGIGSNDSAMPPLKTRRRRRWSKSKQAWVEYGNSDFGYAREKRKLGLNPIRDLYGPGVGWTGVGSKRRNRKAASHMLDELRVVSASPTEARIDITKADARMKARANEQRAPWYGFSGKDIRNLTVAARRMWGENIAAINARGMGSSKWMDPLGISGRAGMDAGFRPTLAGRMANVLSSRYGRAYNLGRAA